MVLADLGSQLTGALSKIYQAKTIDQKLLDECLKDICRALLQADVNVRQVQNMRENVKKEVQNVDEMASGLNKQKVIEKAVFQELCKMLDSGVDSKSLLPKKGRSHVVMFVGLQGSGKTTTCTKFAYYFKKKGFKPAVVCADTFRAGAFDQLKQNCVKVAVPYYGDYSESDPAIIARKGVRRFQEEGRDLIIVDTSGRHKQEEALFEEMKQVESAVDPDLSIFVMDGSIGQAAFDQAKAFKDSVGVGGVIITKLDGHAKGGGALSAVSATKSPVLFIGTGEHFNEFEEFEGKSFVGRILGKGDPKRLFDMIQDVLPQDDQSNMMESIQKGNFTMRLLLEQYQSVMKMGPMSQIMSMIPGFQNQMITPGRESESSARIKGFMVMMDSMTDKELDSKDIKIWSQESRLSRIAKGSGRLVVQVQEMVAEYKKLHTVITNLAKKMGAGGAGMRGGNPMMNAQKAQQMMQQMGGNMPQMQQMMQQMGGLQGMQKMMQQFKGQM